MPTLISAISAKIKSNPSSTNTVPTVVPVNIKSDTSNSCVQITVDSGTRSRAIPIGVQISDPTKTCSGSVSTFLVNDSCSPANAAPSNMLENVISSPSVLHPSDAVIRSVISDGIS